MIPKIRIREDQIGKDMTISPARPLSPLSYQELVSALGDEWVTTIHPQNYRPITGIFTDSRHPHSIEGEMFLGLDGERFKGIDFIPAVYASGTRIFAVEEKQVQDLEKLLSEKDYRKGCFLVVKNSVTAYGIWAAYYLSQMGGLRIAITGSTGKTTSKEMLVRVLSKNFGVFCNYKNENNHIGVPKNIFALQRRLMDGERIHVIVLEMGMNHAGEIGYLASLIKPNLSVITNILYSHIGNFSCREDLVSAKGEVIPHLTGHDSIPDHPGGVLSITKEIFGKEELRQQVMSLPAPIPTVIEVEPSVTADSQVQHGENDLERLAFFSKWRDQLTEEEMTVPGISIFSNETISLILAAAEILGIPRREGFHHLAKILQEENIEEVNPPLKVEKANSRLQVISQPGKPVVIDDAYNANPVSVMMTVRAIIGLLPQFPARTRLIIILGDMLELGIFSESLHRECADAIDQSIENIKTLPSSDCQERLDLFFVGSQMKICYDNIKFSSKKYHAQYSPQHPELLWDLNSIVDEYSVVFFKASYGMKFNQLITDFLDSQTRSLK